MRVGGARGGLSRGPRDSRLLASRHFGWVWRFCGRNREGLGDGGCGGDGLDKNRRERSRKVEDWSRAGGVEEISKKDSYGDGQQDGQQFGWGRQLGRARSCCSWCMRAATTTRGICSLVNKR